MTHEYEARVAASHGSDCIVEPVGGGPLRRCILRRRGSRPVCGDTVVCVDTAPGEGVVERIHPRRSLIERGDFRGRPRPLAANVDRMIVVIADPPGIDTLLVDRYVTLGCHIRIAIQLWVNKADRLSPETCGMLEHRLSVYPELGIPLAFVSAHAAMNAHAPAFAAANGVTSILVGQSGVGKSSLVNALLPDIDQRVGALSAISGQGRHTTTATTLFNLSGGGALIDSPGVRTLRLDHLPGESVLAAFPEIRRHVATCRFRDCAHDGEPGCAVQQALRKGRITAGRYRNFRTLLAESQPGRA